MQKLTLAELAAEPVEMLPGRETLLFNFNASLIEAQNASYAVNAASALASAVSGASQTIVVAQS